MAIFPRNYIFFETPCIYCSLKSIRPCLVYLSTKGIGASAFIMSTGFILIPFWHRFFLPDLKGAVSLTLDPDI